MKYKEFKITALMEMGEDPPVIFTFNLGGVDENSEGMTLSKMDSVEETELTKPGSIHKE